jgi:hypothetical protein
MSPTLDPDQLAALRMRGQRFGDVQVLVVQPMQPAGGAGTPAPSLASQQLALDIHTPPVPCAPAP